MARRGLMPFACWSDKSPKGQKNGPTNVVKILEGKGLATLNAICRVISLAEFGFRTNWRRPEIIQAKTIPRAAPMLTPGVNGNRCALALEIFRPVRNASLSLPAVSCVKLKNGAQGIDRRPYYFQISKSWESFSHAQLTPTSTAGAWMPLRHPWTAAIHPGFG
jgi:hypothetical protein